MTSQMEIVFLLLCGYLYKEEIYLYLIFNYVPFIWVKRSLTYFILTYCFEARFCKKNVQLFFMKCENVTSPYINAIR